MAEPVSVGVWAARKTSIGPGDRVLVTEPVRSACTPLR